MMQRTAFSVFMLAGLLFIGCGSDKDVGDCHNLPMSQGPTEPCCPDYGVDACGAGLFCAAFDGRVQATCYAERSRLDGTECGADIHCASGSCNTDAWKCRSSPSAACDPTLGCAPDMAGGGYVCSPEDDKTCRPIGDGEIGDLCAESSDCQVGQCNLEIMKCYWDLGQTCDPQAPRDECVGTAWCETVFQLVQDGEPTCTIECDSDTDCHEAGLSGGCCKSSPVTGELLFCVPENYCAAWPS